ncbi:MAG: hypothetical protein U0263_36195 [Polyangiaceae bacterium]
MQLQALQEAKVLVPRQEAPHRTGGVPHLEQLAQAGVAFHGALVRVELGVEAVNEEEQVDAPEGLAIRRAERDAVPGLDALLDPRVDALDLGAIGGLLLRPRQHGLERGVRGQRRGRFEAPAGEQGEKLRAAAREIERGLVEQVQEQVVATNVDDERIARTGERDVREVLLGADAQVHPAGPHAPEQPRDDLQERGLVRDGVVLEELPGRLRELADQGREVRRAARRQHLGAIRGSGALLVDPDGASAAAGCVESAAPSRQAPSARSARSAVRPGALTAPTAHEAPRRSP